jgi:nucleoside-diphosphate-sugar epimerase
MPSNFWLNKTIAVTGGAGLIGSAFVRNINSLGASVVILDNLSRGSEANLKGVDVELLKLDLSHRKSINTMIEVFQRCDVVVHLASVVGGIGVYTSKPWQVFNTMMDIDNNVLEALIESGTTKYFYASSSHIYPIELQSEINSPPIREDQDFPANPELSYGFAKLVSEKNLIYRSKEKGDIRCAIARFIGIYGPGQEFGLETGSVIPVFSYRAIKFPEVPFRVWGTGVETRSYCYIDDAIEAMKLMIEKLDDSLLVGPYNVGKQERISISEIAKKVIDISGKEITVDYDTEKETLIWGQWSDCQKILRELGWEAKTPFDEGLKKVYSDIEQRTGH